MKNKTMTEFKLSLDMKKMRELALKIAKENDMKSSDEQDAFRHAYVSAKLQESIRTKGNNLGVIKEASEGTAMVGSYLLGAGVEWLREITDRAKSNLEKGNPKDEWAQDMSNNAEGRKIERQIEQYGLPEELKEQLLRHKLAKSVKNGSLQVKPSLDKQRYYSGSGNDKAGLEKVYPNDPNVAVVQTKELHDSDNKSQSSKLPDVEMATAKPQTLETMFAERDKKREQQMLAVEKEIRKREQKLALANARKNKKWSIV